MKHTSSFKMEQHNQKPSRSFRSKKKEDQSEYDRFEHKSSSYKRREKYNSWKHTSKDDEDDLDWSYGE